MSECKNNGECTINKKNRTSCKACRLRKCLLVGMSKSGSRYGRRSNWFKIHCLLQEQQEAKNTMNLGSYQKYPAYSQSSLGNVHPYYASSLLPNRTASANEDYAIQRLNENLKSSKSTLSPSISSPESLNSESSTEISDKKNKASKDVSSIAKLPFTDFKQDFMSTLHFNGYPIMPNFLPTTSHFLFSNYQNALHEQSQFLLRQRRNSSERLNSHDVNVEENSIEQVTEEFSQETGKVFRLSKRRSSEIEEKLPVKFPRLLPFRNTPREDIKVVCERPEVLKHLTPPNSPHFCGENNVNPIDLSLKSEKCVKIENRNTQVERKFVPVFYDDTNSRTHKSYSEESIDVEEKDSPSKLAPLDLTSKI